MCYQVEFKKIVNEFLQKIEDLRLADESVVEQERSQRIHLVAQNSRYYRIVEEDWPHLYRHAVELHLLTKKRKKKYEKCRRWLEENNRLFGNYLDTGKKWFPFLGLVRTQVILWNLGLILLYAVTWGFTISYVANLLGLGAFGGVVFIVATNLGMSWFLLPKIQFYFFRTRWRQRLQYDLWQSYLQNLDEEE